MNDKPKTTLPSKAAAASAESRLGGDVSPDIKKSDLPEFKRNYQAEVHFALGAVIQGITVAALGNELAAALRALPFPGAVWVFIT
jgi:hypothetical protein